MRNSFARANPLLGLTAEEYVDFARALVSYVALHATVEQTTYFMNLCRDYTREIASKAAIANEVSRESVSIDAAMRSLHKKSLSH